MRILFKALSVLLFMSSCIVHAEETPSIVSQVNQQYYNIKSEGLRAFECEVLNSVFEQLKASVNSQGSGDPSKVKILNDIKFDFKGDLEEPSSFRTSGFVKSGDEQFDEGMQQVIEGTEQMIQGFFDTWKGFVTGVILDDTIKYDINNMPDGGQSFSALSGGIATDILMDKNKVVIAIS